MQESLVIEYGKDISESITAEIMGVFPEADIIEVNSFGIDTVVQAIVTIVTAMLASSAVATLITKLVRDKNITVKYDGIEIQGDYKNVNEIIDKINSIKNVNVND